MRAATDSSPAHRTLGSRVGMVRVKNPQDFWSGILFIAFGGLALWFGRDLRDRQLERHRPGLSADVAEHRPARASAAAGTAGARDRRAGDREEPDPAATLHPRGDRGVRVRHRTPRTGAHRHGGRRHGVVRAARHALVGGDRARGRARGAVRRAVRSAARTAVHGLAASDWTSSPISRPASARRRPRSTWASACSAAWSAR